MLVAISIDYFDVNICCDCIKIIYLCNNICVNCLKTCSVCVNKHIISTSIVLILPYIKPTHPLLPLSYYTKKIIDAVYTFF